MTMDAGSTIKGYELHERIGSGGFGVVYRAYQTTVGREVAIKIILPHFANQPDFIRRFETEAQLIARLEHPHIVPLYDYWRDPEGAYLVMRWLRGGSLRDKLKEGPLELETAAHILDQVSSALDLAHRHHVVHRDLKPANVLLDEDGNAYLSDFGIAKDVGDPQGGQTGSGMIVGSPDYLAPEQARSDPVTPQTDIYSLGVMLYEMLAGAHPFPDKTPVERMYKHLNEPLPLVATPSSDLDSAINAIIQKATAKNPAHRYASAREMAAAFRDGTALSITQEGGTLVEQLTLREQEILQFIIEGCSNQEIAQRLFVTLATVKWHVWQLYRKLRVRSRVQAIVRARELNLVVSETGGEPADTEATYIPLPEPENPYKGLHSFEAADARDFFGREKLVQKLVKRIGENHKAARFLAVVGPSGSGKSSVVKAGVIPALWRGDIPGSDRWFVVEMVPGARPLDELEVALTRIAATYTDNLRQQLERDRHGLLRVAGLILPNDGSELVIVVDQFEELFTLVQDEQVRAHFLSLLHAAVTDPRSRVRVIVTLRADFYDRPLHYPELGELVRSHMETVLPLSAEELEAAIVKPAERVGVSFEPGLAATIIADSHYQPGALPLLQYALTELFEQREGRVLTQKAYQALGGAVGALAQRADEIYLEQPPEGREAIHQMFLRLVTLGEDAEDTRRRVPRSELLGVAADPAVMDEIIDTFAAYRLLTLDHDPVTRSPTVEMAHEAILREWARLRNWLDNSRHDIRQQRILAAASADWLRAGKDPSYLLRGARLDQFAAWSSETGLALTPKERTFLETSLAQQTREEENERERQARELSLAHQAAESAHQAEISQRRAANRLRYLAAGLLVFLMAALALSLFAFGKQRDAEDARATSDANLIQAEQEALINHSLALNASAREVWTQGDHELGLALAIEANRVPNAPSEVNRTLADMAYAPGLRKLIGHHEAPIYCAEFTPDGRYILTGAGRWLDIDPIAEDNTLRLWDVETDAEVRRFVGHADAVVDVRISPDGRTAISGSWDQTLIRWNLETGEIIHRFEGHTGAIAEVVLSPDGQTVLSAGYDGTVRLWDVETGAELHQFADLPDPVLADLLGGAFSPDSRIAYVGAIKDYETELLITWDIENNTEIRRLELPFVTSFDGMAVSPDGRTAAISQENDALIIDLETGDEIRRFIGHNNGVYPLIFTPDGNMLLSGSFDNTIRIWDVKTGQEFQRFQSHNVLTLDISPDGRTVVAASSQAKSVQLWDLTSGLELHRYSAPDVNGIWSVTLSPDGRDIVAGAGMGGTIGDMTWNHNADIIVWDRHTGQELRRLQGHTIPAASLDFSPDGRTLLSGSCCSWIANDGTTDGTARLWNWQTGQEIQRFSYGDYDLLGVFSPDGRTAMFHASYTSWGAADPFLRLVDVQTGQTLRQLYGHTSGIMGGAYTQDGHTFISVSYDGTIRLWDVETGEEIRRIDVPDVMLQGLALSPDDRTILVGALDNIVRLFDLETGKEIRHFDTKEITNGLAFSPDGRTILTGSYDGVLILWDVATGESLVHFIGHTEGTGGIFTPEGTVVSMSWDGTVREWEIPYQSPDELIAWTHANRYVRELTEDKRKIYHLDDRSSTLSSP